MLFMNKLLIGLVLTSLTVSAFALYKVSTQQAELKVLIAKNQQLQAALDKNNQQLKQVKPQQYNDTSVVKRATTRQTLTQNNIAQQNGKYQNSKDLPQSGGVIY